MDNTAFVQAQDEQGNWRTYSITMNDPIVYLATEKSLKVRFPRYRVRTIDSSGRILDIFA